MFRVIVSKEKYFSYIFSQSTMLLQNIRNLLYLKSQLQKQTVMAKVVEAENVIIVFRKSFVKNFQMFDRSSHLTTLFQLNM